MKSKYTVIIILVCVSGLFSCNRENEQGKTVVLKVGECEFSNIECNEILSKYLIFYSNSEDTAKTLLFNDLIQIGLLYNHIISNDSLKVSPKKHLDDIEFVLNALRTIKTARVRVNEKDILKSYKRGKEKLIINYIWSSPDHKSISQNFHTYIKAGAKPSELKKNSELNFKSDCTRFEEGKIIYPGTLIPELEKKVFEMKVDEVKLIATKGGYHIVQLLRREPNRQLSYKMEQETIKKRMVSAIMLEQGEILFDLERLKRKVKLNNDLISFTDFNIIPLNPDYSKDHEEKDQTVLAYYDNRTYTIADIKKKVILLPDSIQDLFINQQTRPNALKAIILKDADPFYQDKNERMDKNNKEQVAPQKLMKKILVFDKGGNKLNEDKSIENLESLLSRDYCFGKESILNFIQRKSVKGKKNKEEAGTDDNIMINPEEWIDTRNCKTLLPVSINTSLLSTLEFKRKRVLSEEIIAKRGKWRITVGDFENEIDNYDLKTLELITPLKQRMKVVKYLEQVSFKNKADYEGKLLINKESLYKINVSKRILALKYPYNESSLVGKLEGIKIKLGDLRENIDSLPDELKEQLNNKSNLKEYIEGLLLNKYLFSIYEEEIKSYNDEIEDIRSKKSKYLFVKEYLKSYQLPEGFSVADSRLDVAFRLLLKDYKEQKIEEICSSAKELEIFFSEKYFKERGININTSIYQNRISPIEQ